MPRLERHGYVERDIESSYISEDFLADDELLQLQGPSISYRIAVGPNRGKKVLTLQTLPPQPEGEKKATLLGKINGFSLQVGVAAKAHQHKKRERLCRYITRPAVAEKRLSLTKQGKVRYELKTAYRNGTTHIIFEPLDFIARLAALVPNPRVNLIRFHGVFAPNSKLRGLVTNNTKKQPSISESSEAEVKTDFEKKGSMTWAMRLKRVFAIDISQCQRCGGEVKVIACIEEPAVIKKILGHIESKQAKLAELENAQPRAPPEYMIIPDQEDLFF